MNFLFPGIVCTKLEFKYVAFFKYTHECYLVFNKKEFFLCDMRFIIGRITKCYIRWNKEGLTAGAHM